MFGTQRGSLFLSLSVNSLALKDRLRRGLERAIVKSPVTRKHLRITYVTLFVVAFAAIHCLLRGDLSNARRLNAEKVGPHAAYREHAKEILRSAFNPHFSVGARSKVQPNSSTDYQSVNKVQVTRFARKSTPAIPRRNKPMGRVELEIPKECSLWRAVATDITKVHPYRQHFTSLDLIDWFVFVSFFNEQFHERVAKEGRRGRYLDVAANHCKKWSNTWFFDRCMGWDGICVEANPKYKRELLNERHCHLIDTCVSDKERTVEFAFTDAYGGVIKSVDSQSNTMLQGVNGRLHSTSAKYRSQFHGIRKLNCTTLTKELPPIGMEGRIDFMSLDVEGHELSVLKGIDWDKTEIDVIVCENQGWPIIRYLSSLNKYIRFSGVLKDDIYIRKGSGYTISPKFENWMRHLNRTTYRFKRN